MQASRYIHLNPVAAGLVRSPEDWPWSSARAYLGLVPAPKWLHAHTILDMFSAALPATTYRVFLALGIDERTAEFYRYLRW